MRVEHPTMRWKLQPLDSNDDQGGCYGLQIYGFTSLRNENIK